MGTAAERFLRELGTDEMTERGAGALQALRLGRRRQH
jgi:hypothetical protein